jgi:hypothetical protein
MRVTTVRRKTGGIFSTAGIALTAGSFGLILGALTIGVLLDLSANPSQVADKPAAETTGSARAPKPEVPARDQIDGDSVSDCDQQAWPYITPNCVTEREAAAQRKVRVITTDQIAPPIVGAIEQGVKDVPPPIKDPVAPSNEPERTTNLSPGDMTPPATARPPVAAAPRPTREMKSVPVTVPPLIYQNPTAGAVPRSTPANESQTVASSDGSPPAVSTEQPRNVETKNARGARHNRTRGPKQRRAPVRDRDDNFDEPISPRSRVVRRGNGEFVPSYQTSDRRRMTIVRGGRDQHPFGSIFGSLLR